MAVTDAGVPQDSSVLQLLLDYGEAEARIPRVDLGRDDPERALATVTETMKEEDLAELASGWLKTLANGSPVEFQLNRGPGSQFPCTRQPMDSYYYRRGRDAGRNGAVMVVEFKRPFQLPRPSVLKVAVGELVRYAVELYGHNRSRTHCWGIGFDGRNAFVVLVEVVDNGMELVPRAVMSPLFRGATVGYVIRALCAADSAMLGFAVIDMAETSSREASEASRSRGAGRMLRSEVSSSRQKASSRLFEKARHGGDILGVRCLATAWWPTGCVAVLLYHLNGHPFVAKIGPATILRQEQTALCRMRELVADGGSSPELRKHVQRLVRDEEDGGLLLLVTEYAGESLTTWARPSSVSSRDATKQLLLQIGGVLGDLARARWVHRDISKGNIAVMMDDAGLTFRLIDFGSACPVDGDQPDLRVTNKYATWDVEALDRKFRPLHDLHALCMVAADCESHSAGRGGTLAALQRSRGRYLEWVASAGDVEGLKPLHHALATMFEGPECSP